MGVLPLLDKFPGLAWIVLNRHVQRVDRLGDIFSREDTGHRASGSKHVLDEGAALGEVETGASAEVVGLGNVVVRQLVPLCGRLVRIRRGYGNEEEGMRWGR